jgi:thiol-disulfide isomerase/thioredoxin
MPEATRDDEGNIIDPNFQWRWLRANFFKNFDIFDPDMLRTEFYERKLMDYITRIIPQHTDSINAEIDKILTKSKANDEVFRFILINVFNHYVRKMSDGIIWEGSVVPENVYVHIAERWYIPYATWSLDDFMENLKKRIADTKPNLIGNKAPPIEMLMILPDDHFRAAALDTAIKFDLYAGNILNDFRRELLNSKFTVLYFWEYSCGFCRTSIRELFNIWEEFKDKGLQVITIQAVCCEKDQKGRWIDFINEHELFGWINAWSPYSYKYKELYNITSAPTIYMLDENGEIVFRNIGVEQIRDFFAAPN